VNTRI